MANSTLTNLFVDIADAIREKSDTSESIPALEFPDRIREISGGGGGSDCLPAPDEYHDYITEAKNLYTGDYAHIAVAESDNILNVAFLMDDFKVLSYNESTTEFTAIGWLYCEYTKATQTWRVVDYRTEASTGTNYVKHIRYSSAYWEYNGQVIWPVGAGGGGGAGLNIAYGDTAPDDTTKLWVKAAEPSAVEVTNAFSGAGDISTVATLPSAMPWADAIRFAAVGTKIYQIGGTGSSALQCIHVFDTTTNTFEELTVTFPFPIQEASVAAWGTNVYVFGGYDSSDNKDLNTIYCFDTETNTLELLSVTLPTALKGMGAVTIGDKIYLFGGYYSSSGHKDTIYVFSPTENKIQTLSTTMPIKGGGVVLAAVGTKVYLFETSQTAQICVFNTETNTFDNVSGLPNLEFYKKAAVSFGTKIYLFGGSGNKAANYAKLNTVYTFDTTTNTLELLAAKLPVAAKNISAVRVGGTVYLFGGETGTYVFTNLVNTFSVAAALESNKLLLLASLSANVFNLVDTGSEKITLGVQSAYLGDASGVAQPVEAFTYKDGAWTAI